MAPSIPLLRGRAVREADVERGRLAIATFLREKGFEAVNLAGGMLDWAGAGRAMVAETGDAPAVV